MDSTADTYDVIRAHQKFLMTLKDYADQDIREGVRGAYVKYTCGDMLRSMEQAFLLEYIDRLEAYLETVISVANSPFIDFPDTD